MKFLLFKLIIISLFIGNLFPSFTESQTEWSYVQGINQAFYIFISPMDIIDSDGNTIEGYGDGTTGTYTEASDCGLNPGCDVLGAFVTHELDESTCGEIGGYFVNNQCDVCVGWVYYNSYTESNSGYMSTTIPIIGQELTDEDLQYYCQNGEAPKLKYYDASDDIIYSLTSNIELGSFANNNIFIYSPYEIEDCIEVHFVATAEDDFLSNENADEFPDSFEIMNIYPNPFNPSTQIQYTIGSIEYINISVYDTVGRHIVTLFDGFQNIGMHELIWTPESSISSGSYIIKVETLNDLLTSKVTYLK